MIPARSAGAAVRAPQIKTYREHQLPADTCTRLSFICNDRDRKQPVVHKCPWTWP